MPRSNRLFVYGTLMPGGRLWPALAPYARSWERASAPGRLWDTGAGYPALRFGEGSEIPGVVVVLDGDRLDEVVEMLDAVEGEGRLYRRVAVATSAGPAFAYEWLGPTDGLERLEGAGPDHPGRERSPPDPRPRRADQRPWSRRSSFQARNRAWSTPLGPVPRPEPSGKSRKV